MSNLSDDIEKLRKKVEARAFANDKRDAASFAARSRDDLTAFHRFLWQLAAAAIWLYETLLLPLALFLAMPLRFLWRCYRRLWDRLVHVEDKFGNRLFSKTRAGIMLVISLVGVWYVLLPVLMFLFDLGLYALTVRKNETVYLTNSQEILPQENVHSVQGCHTLPCTDENSFYFRIRATWFNEAWSLVHGHGLFFPDYIAAAVPVSISKCQITSYGVRLKFVMRGMDIYPDVLQTECAPLETGGTKTQP